MKRFSKDFYWDQHMNYELWQGSRLDGSLEMAFDTETTVVDLKKEIPDGVLMTAWAGQGPIAIIPVERWPQFIQLHLDRKWIGHNTAFDFHVVLKILHALSPELSSAWIGLAENNQMFCTMLLDGLVRIASGEADKGKDPASKQPTRNLETLAKAYDVECASPDKASGFRRRFSELLFEPDWSSPHIDPGFFLYAAVDCEATYLLGMKMLQMAWALHNQIPQEKLHPKNREWGPLTSSIQLKASIALADISRRGFQVDLDKAWRAEAQLRMKYQAAVTWLEINCPGLLQFTKEVKATKSRPARRARRQLTPKSETCKMSLKTLRRRLQEEAQTLGIDPPVSDGKEHWISTKADDWIAHENKSEFLHHWIFVKNAEKQLGYLANLRKLNAEDARLRSQYVTLVRTGRTASRSPNIQQTPKLDWFRAIHVAQPGKKLFVCDYSFIELRTVAYCCEKWFERSQLGAVIRQGKDPHSFTASLMMEEPYDQVKKKVKEEKSLPDGEEKPYTKMRQSAKPLNFGSIGGLGPTRLVVMALLDYHIHMTLEEAAAFLDKLITKIYPELNKDNGWLSTNLPELLSDSLQIPFDDVFDFLIGVDSNFNRLGICLDRVLRGCAIKADGTPYSPGYVKKLWALGRLLLAHSPKYHQHLPVFDTYQPSDELADLFFNRSAIIPTGRIRRGLMYTDSKNTPFQGLASDGAKLALWNLWKQGIPVVAFIHDEVVAEVDEDPLVAQEQGELIKQVMISSMEEVMEGFPVDVEGHVEDCWKK